MLAGVTAARRRMPDHVREGLPELGVESVWAFFGVVSPELVEATTGAGVELNVWTVDEPERIRRLAEMGVTGICSNDPRLLQPHTIGTDAPEGIGALSGVPVGPLSSDGRSRW